MVKGASKKLHEMRCQIAHLDAGCQLLTMGLPSLPLEGGLQAAVANNEQLCSPLAAETVVALHPCHSLSDRVNSMNANDAHVLVVGGKLAGEENHCKLSAGKQGPRSQCTRLCCHLQHTESYDEHHEATLLQT